MLNYSGKKSMKRISLAFMIIGILLLHTVAVNAQISPVSAPGRSIPPGGLKVLEEADLPTAYAAAEKLIGQFSVKEGEQTDEEFLAEKKWLKTDAGKGDVICYNVEGRIEENEERTVVIKADLTTKEGGGRCKFGENPEIYLPGKVRVTYSNGKIKVYGKGVQFGYKGILIINLDEDVDLQREWIEGKEGKRFAFDCDVQRGFCGLDSTSGKKNIDEYLNRKYASMLNVLDKIIADSNDPLEILEAKRGRARVLELLGKFEEAIAEYEDIARLTEKVNPKIAEDARKNLVRLYGIQMTNSKLSPVDAEDMVLAIKLKLLINMEKLEKLTKDPEIKEYTQSMKKKLQLELLLMYNKKSKEMVNHKLTPEDREAKEREIYASALLTLKFYEALGGEEGFGRYVEEYIKNIEEGMSKDILKKEGFESFKQNLRDLVREGRGTIGLTIDGQAKAEWERDFDKYESQRKEFLDLEKKIGTDSSLMKEKREEIYSHNDDLQSLRIRRDRLAAEVEEMEGVPEDQRDPSFERLSGELHLLNSHIAQRKNLLTGERHPDMFIQEIWETQSKIKELRDQQDAQAIGWFKTGWLPFYGNVRDYYGRLVEEGLVVEIDKLEDELNKKREEWKTALDFNPNEKFLDPMNGGYFNSRTIHREDIEKEAVNFGVSVVSMLAAIYGPAVFSKGMGTLANKGALGSFGEAAAKATESKFFTTFSTAVHPAMFHTISNSARHGLSKLGLGDGVTAHDWSVDSFAKTYAMFAVFGIGSKATQGFEKIMKTSPKLPGLRVTLPGGEVVLSRAGKVVSFGTGVGVPTAMMTVPRAMDLYARSGFNIPHNFEEELSKGALYDIATFGAIGLSGIVASRLRGGMGPIKVPEIEAKRESIRTNPENHQGGRITKEFILTESAIKELYKLDLEWAAKAKAQTPELERNWEINAKQAKLRDKFLDAIEGKSLYDAGGFQVRSHPKFRDKTYTREEELEGSEVLAKLKKNMLTKQKEYYEEMQKQGEGSSEGNKMMIDGLGKEIGHIDGILGGIKAEKEFSQKMRQQPLLEGPNNPLAVIKGALRGIGFTIPESPAESLAIGAESYFRGNYEMAVPVLQDVVGRTSVGKKVHHDAQALLSHLEYEKAYESGDYLVAARAYDNFNQQYPVDTLSEFTNQRTVKAN